MLMEMLLVMLVGLRLMGLLLFLKIRVLFWVVVVGIMSRVVVRSSFFMKFLD